MSEITQRDPSILGHLLRDARKRAGMTQEDAALRVGMLRSTLSALENGKRYVQAEELSLFASCYGVEITSLLAACDHQVQEQEFMALLSPQKNVIRRLLLMTGDDTAYVTLQLCNITNEQIERVAASLLHTLIEREEREPCH